jgi:hypothetical protein
MTYRTIPLIDDDCGSANVFARCAIIRANRDAIDVYVGAGPRAARADF